MRLVKYAGFRLPALFVSVLAALVVLVALVALSGCVSLMEKTGRVLDGSAGSEKTVAVYRAGGLELRMVKVRESREGAWEDAIFILPERFPAVRIRAGAPDGNGVFLLTSLDYLGGNEHGWNEFSLDLFGSGVLTTDGSGSALFSVSADFEAAGISGGRIRRYDTRITGNEALALLNGRHERILALVEWMNAFDGSGPGAGIDGFSDYWEPVLFPERAKIRNRPDGWRKSGDRFARAEGLRWNLGYTERVFPELLRSVRNSGTMLRDWEEAREWLFLMHEWQSLVELLSRETVLVKSR